MRNWQTRIDIKLHCGNLMFLISGSWKSSTSPDKLQVHWFFFIREAFKNLPENLDEVFLIIAWLLIIKLYEKLTLYWVIVLSFSTSMVLLPVALASIICQLSMLHEERGMIKLTPSLIALIYFSDSFRRTLIIDEMYSSIFALVTFRPFPPGHNSTSFPFERRVTKYSSTAYWKSSSLRPLVFIRMSSITL